MKSKYSVLVIWAAAFSFIFAAQAYGYGYVELDRVYITPSIAVSDINIPSDMGAVIGCTNLYTGAVLNCPYTYILEGIDTGDDPQVQFSPPLTQIQIYGGHEHNYDTHPFYYAPSPANPIQVIDPLGSYTMLNPLTVTGQTGPQFALIQVYAPQAAGAVWIEIDQGSPPGYICWPPDYCYTRTDSRTHFAVLVGLFDEYRAPRLAQLPPQGDDYILLRGLQNDPGHGDNDGNDLSSYGTPFTVDEVQRVSALYHQASGNLLSINDMSLPEGGLFDINDDWTPPHTDHRLGIAFDVNTHDASGKFIDCHTDVDFHTAVNLENQRLQEQYPNARLEPLHIVCESGGRIHINVNDPTNPPAFRE